MKKPHAHMAYLIVFFLMLIFLQSFQSHLIFSQDKISSGQVWRIWSGQLVHANYSHLWMNTLGFSIFLIIYKYTRSATQLIIQMTYLSTSIGLSLYFFNPEIHLYAGFSGILYGLFIISAVHAYYRSDYILAYPIFIAITGKVLWEQFDNTVNTTTTNLIDTPVASDAHLYGYIAALVFSIFNTLFALRKQPS